MKASRQFSTKRCNNKSCTKKTPFFGGGNTGLAPIHLHTSPSAAALAQSLQAEAFTHKNHIFFNKGRYNPGSSEGKRLLAHEVAHVKQQATNAEAPAIQRWKMAGNTATAQQGDTLGRLAMKAGGKFNDWKCIIPTSMKTAKRTKRPKNFDDRYELYVQPGDTFDVSNLVNNAGPSLNLHLFDTNSQSKDANLVSFLYPGSNSSGGVDNDIENEAESGKKPLQGFMLFGHAGGGTMWGGASTFEPSTADPEQEAPTHTLAEAGLLPRRCWFSKSAATRLVGCNSDAVGNDFSAHYLRKGAAVTTTTAAVRPKCQGTAYDAAKNTCNSYNGAEFASTSSVVAGTTLDGPFWSTADFHGGRFWTTINGKL